MAGHGRPGPRYRSRWFGRAADSALGPEVDDVAGADRPQAGTDVDDQMPLGRDVRGVRP